jgi:hypothetical protein
MVLVSSEALVARTTVSAMAAGGGKRLANKIASPPWGFGRLLGFMGLVA